MLQLRVPPLVLPFCLMLSCYCLTAIVVPHFVSVRMRLLLKLSVCRITLAVLLPCSMSHRYFWQSNFATRFGALLLCMFPRFRLVDGAAPCGCYVVAPISSCRCCLSLLPPPGVHRYIGWFVFLISHHAFFHQYNARSPPLLLLLVYLFCGDTPIDIHRSSSTLVFC